MRLAKLTSLVYYRILVATLTYYSLYSLHNRYQNNQQSGTLINELRFALENENAS